METSPVTLWYKDKALFVTTDNIQRLKAQSKWMKTVLVEQKSAFCIPDTPLLSREDFVIVVRVLCEYEPVTWQNITSVLRGYYSLLVEFESWASIWHFLSHELAVQKLNRKHMKICARICRFIDGEVAGEDTKDEDTSEEEEELSEFYVPRTGNEKDLAMFWLTRHLEQNVALRELVYPKLSPLLAYILSSRSLSSKEQPVQMEPHIGFTPKHVSLAARGGRRGR